MILSQALKGLAEGVDGRATLDGEGLIQALRTAERAAYGAVAEPKEGTMLTVLRMAANGADAAADRTVLGVMKAAVAAAEAAEAETINQLEALKEAGVTDAGGEGVCAMLRGLLAHMEGKAPRIPALTAAPVAMEEGHAAEAYGYCTEFILEAAGAPVDIPHLKRLAHEHEGRSIVTIGDEEAVRIHVHLDAPERFLEAAAALGTVSRQKVDDMGAQHEQMAATGSGATSRVALLSICHGAGFHELFKGLGAHTLDLGERTKPSAGEIAQAADGLGPSDIIVLPNHENVLMSAMQAREIARTTLHVLPTETLAQGVAAALAYEEEHEVPIVFARMERDAGEVRTVEVSRATADRVADGVDVKADDYIAIVDGTLVLAEKELGDAVTGGVEKAGGSEWGLATMYRGRSVDEGTAAEIAARIEGAFEGIEVDVVDGGQPIHEVIVSLEE